MTHTPAPWNVGWSFWPGDEEIAYGINRGTGTVDDKTARDNAQLIAMAPELLDALQNLLMYVSASGGAFNTESAVAKARAIIAKATQG